MDKIAVCINLASKSHDQLNALSKYVDLKAKKVEFIHAWNSDNYPHSSGMVVAFYPNQDQAREIQKKLEEDLSKLANEFAEKNQCEVVSKVLNSGSEKRAIAKYLDESSIDLAVCLVEKRDNVSEFFHSSFCHYIQVHAKSNVLCLKQ